MYGKNIKIETLNEFVILISELYFIALTVSTKSGYVSAKALYKYFVHRSVHVPQVAPHFPIRDLGL